MLSALQTRPSANDQRLHCNCTSMELSTLDILCLHACNTSPSWSQTSQFSSWSAPHCMQKLQTWFVLRVGHIPGGHGNSTTSVWQRTTGPGDTCDIPHSPHRNQKEARRTFASFAWSMVLVQALPPRCLTLTASPRARMEKHSGTTKRRRGGQVIADQTRRPRNISESATHEKWWSALE